MKDKLLIFIFSFLFALSIGFSYGNNNHNVYLLIGFRMFDPSFLPKDWFTWQTTHPHFAFGYLVYILSHLGSLPIVFGVLNIVSSMAFAYFVYLLIAKFYENPIRPFSCAILLIALTGTFDFVGQYYILSSWFQPSTIGGLCFFISLVALVYGWNLSAGIALGLAGLFHTNYLVWSFLIAIVYIIVKRSHLTKKEKARFLIPYLILPSLNIVILAKYVMSLLSYNLEAQDINIYFRAPFHYVPKFWGISSFIRFFSFISLGIHSLFFYPPSKGVSKTIYTIVLTMLIIVIASTILTTIVFIKPISLMCPWRLVPFIVIFSLIPLGGLISSWYENYYKNQTFRPITLCTFLASLVLLIRTMGYTLEIAGLFLSVALYLILTDKIFSHSALFRKFSPVIPFLLIALLFIRPVKNGIIKSNLIHGYNYSSEESSLYSWIRDNTPSDSLFIIPPTFAEFRLQAQRSVVVELKSYPHFTNELVQWYERLSKISGIKKPKTVADVSEGYKDIDTQRVRMLAEEYGADYLLIYKNEHRGNLDGLREIYVNKDFAIHYIPFSVEIPLHK